MNRVGDFGFGLGIFGCYMVFQSIEFETIFACAPLYANQNFEFFNFEVVAAKKAVDAPKKAITLKALGAYSKRGEHRSNI